MFEPDNEQIQAVIIADDTLSAVATLSDAVNETETLGIEIAPLGIYCQKTGHLIGNRDENSIFSLIKIHGKEYAIWSLYNATSLNVHPAWLETGPEDLDGLIENDPIGYACYCFGLITAQFYQNAKNKDPKRLDGSERYWAMARANTLMKAKGNANLTELNHSLIRLITFMPDAANVLFRHIRKFGQAPDTLALLHCTGELIAKLDDATNKTLDSIGYSNAYIKRTRFIDIAATPEDAARGPSNIRKQRASKRSVAEASMFGELSKLFKDAGLDYVPGFDGLPGTTQWRAKFEKKIEAQEVKELEMLTDLEALAELSNLVIDTDEDDDDNETEFRTLPITGYAANQMQGPLTFGSEGSNPIDTDDNSGYAATMPNNDVENNNNLIIHDEDAPMTTAENWETIEEIATDLIAISKDPIGPIMVEIAKQVVANLPIIMQVHEEVLIQKKMTALERIRMMKGK